MNLDGGVLSGERPDEPQGVIVGGQQPLVFSGLSQLTAFGNKVRVSIFDLTNPNNPTFKAGWNGTDNGTEA